MRAKLVKVLRFTVKILVTVIRFLGWEGKRKCECDVTDKAEAEAEEISK